MPASPLPLNPPPRDKPTILVELRSGAPPITMDPELYEALSALYSEAASLGPSHRASHYNSIRSLVYLPLSTQRDPAWALGTIRLTTAEPGLYLTYQPKLKDWRFELIPTATL